MIPVLDTIISRNFKISHVNPTEIYNEGWMIRLLVHHSIQENLKDIKGIEIINGGNIIDFSTLSEWCSEALISTPFPRISKIRIGEGYTHADMALGDFEIDFRDNGELKVKDDAQIFGILEAKMNSALSSRVTNAKDYNQASRNIACIIHNTLGKNCETFFGVVAPKKKLTKLSLMLKKKEIWSQVKGRIENYNKSAGTSVDLDLYKKGIESCNVFTLSFENWIENFEEPLQSKLDAFYKKTKEWNRIK